ncbi:sensor domain-containing diguanylate cyclase [Paenalkalicoccus suaedae]|uniref:Sensor domain-containing diguanylate cyclase n=1 Tax=Paenalkalicoccus suaedae TaxID=2592382 RepID=A0A859FGZ2_9BACI|nr:sensor domain-containing diguanylate cyclase [Paenalkalicoccus suaedae]QKS72070.1 sensor domain-containing diguanylate cyclase [Paenalkalicoccus suaedae]
MDTHVTDHLHTIMEELYCSLLAEGELTGNERVRLLDQRKQVICAVLPEKHQSDKFSNNDDRDPSITYIMQESKPFTIENYTMIVTVEGTNADKVLFLPETIRKALLILIRTTLPVHRKAEAEKDAVLQLLSEMSEDHSLLSFSERFIHYFKHIVQEYPVTLFLKEEATNTFHPLASSLESIKATPQEHIVSDIEISHWQPLRVHNLQFEQADAWEGLLSGEPIFLLPILSQKEIIGAVGVHTTFSAFLQEQKNTISSFIHSFSPWFATLRVQEKMLKEKMRKELLLKVNKTFHSSMDVNKILEEVLLAIKGAYPSFRLQLFLSHDWEVADELPVKPLDLQTYRDGEAAQAYLSGQTQVVRGNGQTHVYVPLKGKQGIYGVCQIKTPFARAFTDEELSFIQVLTDTGGMAIENADLYQQSRQHIEDLQIINQTAHELNANRDISEAVHFMEAKMKQVFEADAVGFMMFQDRWYNKSHRFTLSEETLMSDIMRSHMQPLLDRMQNGKEEIFIGDWSRESEKPPFLSVIGIPMIHDDEVIGAAFVFGKNMYAFSFETFKLCQSLVHHSTLAFVNAMLLEEMKSLLVTDYLTNLYTRAHMDERVQQSMEQDEKGAFILLDIDRFKLINDKHGHQIGDAVLVQVGQVIKMLARDALDIPVRWGGEELALYLPSVDMEYAYDVAEKIRELVPTKTNPSVTVSCGVSVWKKADGVPSLTKLFGRADEAMYHAKNSGRNKVVLENKTQATKKENHM